MVDKPKADPTSEMFKLDLSHVTPPPDFKEEGAEEKPDATAEAIAGLQKQLIELQKQNADLVRVAVERPVTVQLPSIQAVSNAPAVPSVNLDNLPNPALDPDGFKKQLAERVNSSVVAATKSATEQAGVQARGIVNQQANRDRAWDLIRERSPDIAKSETLVKLAAGDYVTELNKRGINADDELARDVSAFSNEVIKRAEKMLSDIRGPANKETTGQDLEDEEDTGRAMNMLGQPHNGSQSGRTPKREAPGNLVNEIKKIQHELHLY